MVRMEQTVPMERMEQTGPMGRMERMERMERMGPMVPMGRMEATARMVPMEPMDRRQQVQRVQQVRMGPMGLMERTDRRQQVQRVRRVRMGQMEPTGLMEVPVQPVQLVQQDRLGRRGQQGRQVQQDRLGRRVRPAQQVQRARRARMGPTEPMAVMEPVTQRSRIAANAIPRWSNVTMKCRVARECSEDRRWRRDRSPMRRQTSGRVSRILRWVRRAITSSVHFRPSGHARLIHR